MNILAIESSCDECSAAVIEDGEVTALRTVTQSVHSLYGGVVPELAGRSHLELVDKLVAEVLEDSAVSNEEVDRVAATVGPGLIGSLLVGSNYARGVSLAIDRPFRGIHHLEAHLWSAEIGVESLPLPFLVLLVSGGHTLIIRVDGLRSYEVLGGTLDDALGEAYDKVGKLFGLGFPAGASVDRLAVQGGVQNHGITPPMMDDSLDLSFSGLKTAVLYMVRNLGAEERVFKTPQILAAFQEAALQSVIVKVGRAASKTYPRALVAAGGVAANSRLRVLLAQLAQHLGIPCCFPLPTYCTDNAAMIGYLAWKLEVFGIDDGKVTVRPRWPIGELPRETRAA